MGFQIQLGEDEYRILGPDGEEGDLVEYGQPASLVIEAGSHRGSYTVYCPDAEEGEWEPPEGRLFRGQEIPVEVTEVMFEYQEEEEDQGEDEPGDEVGD